MAAKTACAECLKDIKGVKRSAKARGMWDLAVKYGQKTAKTFHRSDFFCSGCRTKMLYYKKVPSRTVEEASTFPEIYHPVDSGYISNDESTVTHEEGQGAFTVDSGNFSDDRISCVGTVGGVQESICLSNETLLKTFVIPKLPTVEDIYCKYKIHASDRNEQNSFVKFFKKREEDFDKGTAEYTTRYSRNFEIRKQLLTGSDKPCKEPAYESTLNKAKNNVKPSMTSSTSSLPNLDKPLQTRKRIHIEMHRIHPFTGEPDFVSKIIKKMSFSYPW